MYKRIIQSITLFSIMLMSPAVLMNAYAGVPFGIEADNQQYTITPSANGNGSVSPQESQTVNQGSTVVFTATPNTNYMVATWTVDGIAAQTGGVIFTLKNVMANHSVNVTFLPKSLWYAGGANGYLYFTMNEDTKWQVTPTQPNPTGSIESIYATNNALYVGTTGTQAYYSYNNGTTWNASLPTPDNGSVNSIFVTPTNTIYIGTSKGHIYYSKNLSGSWSATPISPGAGKAINSIYVTANNALYVGSTNGKVYYSPNGSVWKAVNGSPDGSPIRDIYIAQNTLYVGTAKEFVYSTTSLTGGGTWNLFAQTVYSLFVSSNANVIGAATQDGYVFSLITGRELGFTAATRLNSLFFLG